MNDEILAQQLAKTGDLMDLFNDEMWYRRLYGHLEQFMSEQVAWIEALLAEHKQQLPMAERTVRTQTTVMLAQMFTQED
ncbi:MAG: hypothetical protein AAFO59_03695 [Cyanobacteria bacterium J06607_17]